MVSVIIVTYSDELYIEEQIRSILPQLGAGDEIIVCDDKVNSKAEKTVSRIAREDSRVIWAECRGKGKTAAFVNGIRHSKGDIIFVCEKGNVWLPDKLKRVREAFDDGAELVVHNAYVTDPLLSITDYSLFEKVSVKRGVINNIRRSTFPASCIAFDRRMLKRIMPVPKSTSDYAQWVGLVCEIYGKVKYIDMPLMYYRRINREIPTGAAAAKKKFPRWSLVTKLYKRVFLGG